MEIACRVLQLLCSTFPFKNAFTDGDRIQPANISVAEQKNLRMDGNSSNFFPLPAKGRILGQKFGFRHPWEVLLANYYLFILTAISGRV